MIRLMKSAAERLVAVGQDSLGGRDLRSSLVEVSHPVLGIAGLDLVLPDGSLLPSRGEALATLRFHDWRALRALLMRDQVGLFEAYLDQQLDL